MNRLVGLEITRLTSRRAVRLLTVVLLLILVVVGITTFFKSHKTTPAVIEKARSAMVAEHDRCLRGEIKPFDAPPGVQFDQQQFCDDTFNPDNVEVDTALHITALKDVVRGSSIFMVILGLVIGATFMGAEWGEGTIVTLLAWEPRRFRVILAKMIACAIVVFIGAIVFEVLLGGSLTPAAIFRGNTDGATAGWFRDVIGAVLRCGVLAVCASAIGLSMATVSRNTAAAVGITFVYMAVIENVVRGVLPGFQRWLLTLNAGRFIVGEYASDFPYRSTLGAGLLVIAYAMGAFALSTAFFKRRDIT